MHILSELALFSGRSTYLVKRKINIAIDGYSSCGKSTLAKSLAKELNFMYVDSGAMYRAVTLYALQHGLIGQHGELDEDGLAKMLELVLIAFKYNPESGKNEPYLNGQNVEREIRSLQVSNHVSKVSDVKSVRVKLVKLQRRLAEQKGVVMDGRDIGTVVIPDAELKIFMIADNQVRAQRRFSELQRMGVESTLGDVLKNINDRDEYDTTRKNDPLRRAEDAVVLDNTHLTLDEQFDFVLNQVRKKMAE
jgi:cytidylate kinase